MEKFQKPLNIAIILAETSHIFCCVLPTIVSLMSLLAGVGVIGSLPVSMLVMHDMLHAWEMPIIIGSGLLLALGWCVVIYSRKIDCVDVGCCDKPCTTKKRKSSRLLEVATILFIVNVTIYSVFHRGMGVEIPHASDAVQEQGLNEDHHGHHGHNH